MLPKTRPEPDPEPGILTITRPEPDPKPKSATRQALLETKSANPACALCAPQSMMNGCASVMCGRILRLGGFINLMSSKQRRV